MKLNFFNRLGSVIKPVQEELLLQPSMLIADNMLIDCLSSPNLKISYDMPSWGEDMYFKAAELFFIDDPDMLAKVQQIEAALPTIKIIRKLKHLDKKAIATMHAYKKVMEQLKNSVKIAQENIMRKSGLSPLTPFIEKGNLEILVMQFFDDVLKEDPIISLMIKAIIDKDSFLLLTNNIEINFSFTTFDSEETGTFDFIKIPLWTIPPILTLTHEQMVYTRENLKPFLDPFKADMLLLREQISDLNLSEENLRKIKQLCNERMIHHIASVQQAWDESIYVSKLKNQITQKVGITFCLGIASVETMLNYYDVKDIVEPYVVNELKEQLERHIDLKACQVFMYCEPYTIGNEKGIENMPNYSLD